ncbi:hypothetical protein U14_02314 [Candidatus Moduliflexus flocculans]|uniref:Uncharacterized protein n=1 Tax=Candidatus Moduliflexus flocculans TaxID=1499966 RepID=A0A0S6VUB2_9BACT|nr:hypothetical protein U14_02314 [Candidatus Moduliflexus flocculans]
MAELTLISESPTGFRALIESALAHESGFIEIGIRQTEQRIQVFERRYAMKTADFLSRYEQDGLEETLDFAEWIGEFRLLERLREKMRTLRGIHFAN